MLGACSLLRRFIVQVSHNHLFCLLLEVAAKFLCVCMVVFLCLYVRACTIAFAGMLSFHGDHCHHLHVAESPSSLHVKRETLRHRSAVWFSVFHLGRTLLQARIKVLPRFHSTKCVHCTVLCHNFYNFLF